ncbi:hypothetical protein HYW61_00145 [candidate division WWE3 bacterium]|nr:hypothetical protein [candidate division WWE3 bacterium]
MENTLPVSTLISGKAPSGKVKRILVISAVIAVGFAAVSAAAYLILGIFFPDSIVAVPETKSSKPLDAAAFVVIPENFSFGKIESVVEAADRDYATAVFVSDDGKKTNVYVDGDTLVDWADGSGVGAQKYSQIRSTGVSGIVKGFEGAGMRLKVGRTVFGNYVLRLGFRFPEL